MTILPPKQTRRPDRLCRMETYMRKLVLLVVFVAMAWPLAAATKRKAPKRRTHSVITPSHKAPRSQRMRRPKSTVIRPRRHTRSYQQAPTPERYKEIQQALAEKGYFRGEPNGEWGPDSVD